MDLKSMRADANAVDITGSRHPILEGDVGRDAGRNRWLVCRSGTQLFALPLSQVMETMRPLPIKAVSGAPSYVRGVCVIRGAPTLVADAGLLLSGETVPQGRLVTLAAGPRTVALAVEAVSGIYTLEQEARNQLPPLLRAATQEAIDEIGTLDSELLFCLQTARIVPEDMLEELYEGRAPS